MNSSMDKMLKTGVKGVREGADVVTHTLGDVLDEVKARVDDLVDVAHPRKSRARRSRGAVAAAALIAVVGWFVIRRLMSKPSTVSTNEAALAGEHRQNGAAKEHTKDHAVGSHSGTSAKASKSHG